MKLMYMLSSTGSFVGQMYLLKGINDIKSRDEYIGTLNILLHASYLTTP